MGGCNSCSCTERDDKNEIEIKESYGGDKAMTKESKNSKENGVQHFSDAALKSSMKKIVRLQAVWRGH
jgi:hypothetical protein